ncbi:hypothetical protein HNQ59_001232 [Chitinivorax tropicus]|uniref:Uncharacterized protein n=1 Tax=Chitinivorax tropicus TaxID=714531 RepID=A0A840MM09_9PROT|nr:hypothetical protein [Chitinivorax tropicus]
MSLNTIPCLEPNTTQVMKSSQPSLKAVKWHICFCENKFLYGNIPMIE